MELIILLWAIGVELVCVSSSAGSARLSSSVIMSDDSHVQQNYNSRRILSDKSAKDSQVVTKAKPKGLPYDRTAYGNETVNPHNFSYIHQPQPCTSSHAVLVAVHSAVPNRAKRNVMRSTWANPNIFKHFLHPGYESKLIFILGTSTKSIHDLQVTYEADVFKDILQVGFNDHYRNNTYKAIYNMKWISSQDGCPKVKLVIKTDDDIMFNLRYLEGFWQNFTKLLSPVELQADSLILAGNMDGHRWPGRDIHEKWYISFEEYKFSSFPPWVQGMAYFLTPSLARRIYELSFSTPYLFTDDVYISIVADRVNNVTSKDIRKFFSSAYNSHKQNVEVWSKTNRVFFHAKAPSLMYELWLSYCSCKDCMWNKGFIEYLKLLCGQDNPSRTVFSLL